jgi:hypothetical protein
MSGCKGFFKSWDDYETKDLTKYLLELLDTGNPLNSETIINGDRRDGIGLGMSTEKLLKYKVGEMDTIGVICSGNINPGFSKSGAPNLKCSTII